MLSSDEDQLDDVVTYQGELPKVLDGYINKDGVKPPSDVKTEGNVKQKDDKGKLLIEKDKENSSYNIELATSKFLNMDDSMYDVKKYPNPPQEFLDNCKASKIDLNNSIPAPPNSNSLILSSQLLMSQLLNNDNQKMLQSTNKNLKGNNESISTNLLAFTNNLHKTPQPTIPVDKMIGKNSGHQQDKVGFATVSAVKYRGPNKSRADSDSVDSDQDEKLKPRSNPCGDYCLLM